MEMTVDILIVLFVSILLSMLAAAMYVDYYDGMRGRG